MDALRKQLDVLMGANRNGDAQEVTRKYFDRDVCSLYLAGLCPHELFQLTALELVEVEYIPEKTELDGIDEEFRKVFEKFNFLDNAITEENDKKDDSAPDIASKKKADSDSEEEEQDNQQKEKGISNKKKKLQRRMKIAELKQICTRPDVVELSYASWYKKVFCFELAS